MGETQSISSLIYKNLKLKKEEEQYCSDNCFQAVRGPRAKLASSRVRP